MSMFRVALLSSLAAMCFAMIASAQMPSYTKAGPIPSALTSAKSVFISNAGSNTELFGTDFGIHYTGDPDRPYSEFVAALRATGDFNVVNDPAQADLVLELSLVIYSNTFDPMFQLVIYDAKSHYVLWTITRSVEAANRQPTRDKNLDTALSGVLNRFLEVTGKAPAAAH